MRHLLLIGCAALLVSGCGESNQAAENGETAAANLTAEASPAGDTTAIDAATGMDANMAAVAEPPADEADSNATGNDAGTNSD